jgi:hypothetical protein
VREPAVELARVVIERDEEPRAEVVTGPGGFMSTTAPAPTCPSPLEKFAYHGGLMEMLTFLRTGEKPQTECHDPERGREHRREELLVVPVHGYHDRPDQEDRREDDGRQR